jgi:hypothetical protein
MQGFASYSGWSILSDNSIVKAYVSASVRAWFQSKSCRFEPNEVVLKERSQTDVIDKIENKVYAKPIQAAYGKFEITCS